MSRFRCSSRWIVRRGLVAVVAICALGGVKSAAASCGDWLQNHRDTRARDLWRLTNDTTPSHSSSQPAPAHKRPCQGPGCSQRPASDFPVELPTTPVEQHERPCTQPRGQLSPLTCSMLLMIEDQHGPSVLRDRIDRPPRLETIL